MKKKMKKSMPNSVTVMEGIGHEMKMNPPKILAKTKKKSGKKQAEKQRVAILLSKARRAGVKIKKKK